MYARTVTWVRRWSSAVPFPPDIVEGWRVRREQLAPASRHLPAEVEFTIPLTSDRGRVYAFGQLDGAEWVGVWLNTGTPAATMNRLAGDFPELVPMQVAQGECTFRVPMADLGRLLPVLKGLRRRKVTYSQEDLERRRRRMEAINKAKRARCQTPPRRRGATQAA